MARDVVRRQYDTDAYYCDWWYCSTTGFIVKWVIVGVIFAIFLSWFVGGYFHAKRRMKKGLPPLAYHRFLVSRRERSRFQPQYPQQNNVAFYNPQTGRYGAQYDPQGFPMQPWAAPPPAYQDQGFVPPYPGAPGGSKLNPDQNVGGPNSNLPASSGPPPPPATAQGATSIRELDGNNNTNSDRVYPATSPAGPSHHQATVETAK